MTWRLYSLAAVTFVFVTAEMFPIGALPQMASGLKVSDGQVGFLLTGYAVVAGLSAVPVVAATRARERRSLIVGAAVLLAVSQLGMALVPGFWAVFCLRVVGALSHGVVWSAGPVIAARLAGPERAGRASSVVFFGGSAGLVLGSPMAAALSQAFGWRPAAALIGILALLAGAAVRLALPALPAEPVHARSDGSVTPSVWGPVAVISGATIVVVTAHYISYTYLAVLMGDRGVHGAQYALALVAYGAAGLLAVRPVGAGTDRSPRRTAAVLVVVLVLGVAALGVARSGWWAVPGLLAWAGAFAAAPVVLQARVLAVAPGDPDRASAAYVTAFQVGIGGGAALGAVALGALGSGSLPWITVVVALPTLAIVLLARRSFG
ncbi:MFS transporter [Allobranchiibius huperziae]|uniref:Putative MFS family arabinose efflux permease n=1 Tax=Allobranchiibius huperziae TaxID=1874116 RepID=A0A853DML2_9MICO|nr:MFS transporter [Allobranchiibius huperziae]NYJ75365.1 putative MFS family arabinose efflux permease [Allobranchiibius huperziae]